MQKLIKFDDDTLKIIGYLAVDNKQSFTECLNNFIRTNATIKGGIIIKMEYKTINYNPETKTVIDSGLEQPVSLREYENIIATTFTGNLLENYEAILNYFHVLTDN